MQNFDKEIREDAALYLGEDSPIRGTESDEESEEPALEIDFKEISTTISQLRSYLPMLDDRISECKELFETKDSSRKTIEQFYEYKMDILYNLAYIIHPLTIYGRQCLEKAEAVRHDFEELVGVYTTRVTASNVDVFLPLLTADMAEDIRTGRREALGAIRCKDSKKDRRPYAAGILAYYVDTAFSAEDPVLRIEWLFVHEDFRGRGVSDSLIAELVYQMHVTGIEATAVSLVVGDSWEPAIGSVFARWKFEFEPQMDPDTYIRIGDLTDLTQIGEFASHAKPLSSMSAKEAGFLQANALTRDEYRGYIRNLIKDPDYFDMDLSCYVGKKSNPNGLMLVHRTPSGMLRVEYISLGSSSDTKVIPVMAAFVLYTAHEKRYLDSAVDFPIQMDEFERLMEKIVPRQRGAFMVTGILTADFGSIDIDEKLVDGFTSASDEELLELTDFFQEGL